MILKNILKKFKKEPKVTEKPKGVNLDSKKRVYCASCGCYYELSNLYTNETNWMCPNCEKKFRLDSTNRSG